MNLPGPGDVDVGAGDGSAGDDGNGAIVNDGVAGVGVGVSNGESGRAVEGKVAAAGDAASTRKGVVVGIGIDGDGGGGGGDGDIDIGGGWRSGIIKDDRADAGEGLVVGAVGEILFGVVPCGQVCGAIPSEGSTKSVHVEQDSLGVGGGIKYVLEIGVQIDQGRDGSKAQRAGSGEKRVDAGGRGRSNIEDGGGGEGGVSGDFHQIASPGSGAEVEGERAAVDGEIGGGGDGADIEGAGRACGSAGAEGGT